MLGADYSARGAERKSFSQYSVDHSQ